MTQLTNSGFVRTRLDEREEQLKAAAQAIFGNDMDLGSDTMDGQHIGLFAERIADLDELAEAVWNSFDPDGAKGQSLAPYRDWETDRKSTRLNSSHSAKSRMPSSA